MTKVKLLRVDRVLFATVALAGSAFGQHVPEYVPRPGEQRFNRFQYHSTHNSYQRDNQCWDTTTPDSSIDVQLDLWDTWNIELDLRWHESNDFWIMHDCADQCGEASLDWYLSSIAGTRRASHGLTWVQFEKGDNGPCLFGSDVIPFPDDLDWWVPLEAKLEAYFSGRIYTWDEFSDPSGDNFRWPSPQELLRRGKNFIFQVGTFSGSGMFFSANGSNDVVLLSTNGEDVGWTVQHYGDRYITRHWPDFTLLGCPDDDGWAWAVNNNYTFSSSNCSYKSMTGGTGGGLVEAFHPPLPMYVRASDFGLVVQDFGSWGAPYAGADALPKAIARAQAHANYKGASTPWLSMESGTYTSSEGTYSTPARITARGGIVRLE